MGKTGFYDSSSHTFAAPQRAAAARAGSDTATISALSGKRAALCGAGSGIS